MFDIDFSLLERHVILYTYMYMTVSEIYDIYKCRFINFTHKTFIMFHKTCVKITHLFPFIHIYQIFQSIQSAIFYFELNFYWLQDNFKLFLLGHLQNLQMYLIFYLT